MLRIVHRPLGEDVRQTLFRVNAMGEIRVSVRLTNATDFDNARTGRIRPDEVRFLDVEAIVDTGATMSAIPRDVFERLGLISTRVYEARLADGRREATPVSSGMYFDLAGRQAQDDSLILGSEVLIGQTTLEKIDLLADCKRQQLLPHPDEPTGPVVNMR